MIMYRNASEQLVKWKNSDDRKPLILKGALTENFVLQQIRNTFDTEPKYFAPDPAHETDFLVQQGLNIIPIEVKAGENTASASFKSYLKEYRPEKAVRFSKLGYEINDNFTNIPLYLAPKINKMI